MISLKRFPLILAISAFMFSCSVRDEVNVDDIDVNIEVKRFEQDLFAAGVDSVCSNYEGLRNEYGVFVDLFSEKIIGIGKYGDENFCPIIKSFVTDTMIKGLYTQVQAKFSNTNELNSIFTDAFRRYSYYFPNRLIPHVYTFVSGFNLSVGIDSSSVFIGLDRYLGSDVAYYSMLGIPRYMQQKMTPEKISSDALRAWVMGEFIFNDSIDNLMSNMIWEGEVMYITSKLLPKQSIDKIFGFTPAQMKFCLNNEKLMWTYLIEHKQLFSTNSFDISKFVNDAPFTSGFPQESPGRAVVWLGFRIVESFMKNNPTLTLNDLVQISDYNQIMAGAKYRP